MQHLVTTQPELTMLPGDNVPIVRGRYLSRYELLERLNHYADLCVIYGECFLRHEEAQLSREREEILRKELHCQEYQVTWKNAGPTDQRQ